MSRRSKRPLSLAGLRGFEAAARHLSFTLAASELHRTQSSVSRQIQAIESELGKPLFVRKTRALALTAPGQKLLRTVRTALAGIDETVDELRGQHTRARVSVTTYASFASLWLVPRIAAFSREHPEVDIRIDATDEFVDLEHAGIDVALRHCRTDQAPHDAIKLMDEEWVPAIAPSLIARAARVEHPVDLTRQTLLVLEDTSENAQENSWERWFQLAGVAAPPSAPRVLFNYVDQSMQAAVRGQGVVLARSSVLKDFLDRGELVVPFEIRMRSRYRYFLVMNAATREEPHVRAFCEWILRQVASENPTSSVDFRT
jgi:LysR family transcriptional regulator, glycine cleavage system transcriptional activator